MEIVVYLKYDVKYTIQYILDYTSKCTKHAKQVFN